MSTVQNAIKKCDSADAKFEEQLEAIRALEALGTAKAEIFVRDIQSNLLTAGEEKTNKTVPITFIVGSKKEVRAFSSSEAGNIGEVVNNALTAFLSSKKDTIAKGVGALISNALNIFLGQGEASSDTIEMYYVATDGLSPVRIDIKAWFQCVTAKSITTKMERIITVVATKSVIDVTHIDLGTFLYLYQCQFNVDNMTNEELSTAIDEAADIYNKFVEHSNRNKSSDIQRANTPEEDKLLYAHSLGKINQVSDQVTIIKDSRVTE